MEHEAADTREIMFFPLNIPYQTLLVDHLAANR
jgi:hypothetical protein